MGHTRYVQHDRAPYASHFPAMNSAYGINKRNRRESKDDAKPLHNRGNSHCGRPKGRNSPPEEGQKQKSSRLCNFFSIRGSLPPLQSENRPLYGQLSTFSRPDPRFGATRQSLIAKKLQSEPFFCFQPPRNDFRAVSGTWRPGIGGL